MFKNRVEAGKELAKRLVSYGGENPIVLAIPRGGVVVGYEVAKALSAELELIIPRKIGAPGRPELAIGAVSEEGAVILDRQVMAYLGGVDDDYVLREASRQREEIKRRMARYRGKEPYPSLKDRTVIIVDDGVATGSTILAAIESVRNQGAKGIVVAVPVGPPNTVEALRGKVDDVVCLFTPEPFFAIGQFYRDFGQTSDEQVVALLEEARKVGR